MAIDWEPIFRFWGKPPSETERAKCENAERAIRKAISEDPLLSRKSISIVVQGSYRNRTNVRMDSDVDVCVLCNDVILPQYPEASMTLADVGLTPSSYSFAEFKNDVGVALTNYFGGEHVKRGNKAFDLHENTYRVDADVVAAFEHRRYTSRDSYGRWQFLKGTQFISDDGTTVINWPEQQYANGVVKNESTGQRYKAAARILKTLRNEMEENGQPSAKPMASFLLECLAFNVPDRLLNSSSYVEGVRDALVFLYGWTSEYEKCSEWGEVSELKYLFRSQQPWSHQQVNDFIVAAWSYLEFSEAK